MNKNKIIEHVETIVNSHISLEAKTKALLDAQNYINENLNLLEDKKMEVLLEEYLERYKDNQTDNSYTLECRHEINRDFQETFVRILNKANIDGYGSFEGDTPSNIKEEYKETFDKGGYENDTFYIRPYNWDGISYSDCTCGLDDKLDELELDTYSYGFHSKDCIAWETNFYYKPTNLKIAWYKYALRSAYSNQIIKEDVIKLVLEDCVKSVILENDKDCD